MPHNLSEEVNKNLNDIKRGLLVSQHEAVRVTKSGRYIHVSVTLSPIRDRRGKIIGVTTISRDITKSKALEQEILHIREIIG